MDRTVVAFVRYLFFVCTSCREVAPSPNDQKNTFYCTSGSHIKGSNTMGGVLGGRERGRGGSVAYMNLLCLISQIICLNNSTQVMCGGSTKSEYCTRYKDHGAYTVRVSGNNNTGGKKVHPAFYCQKRYIPKSNRDREGNLRAHRSGHGHSHRPNSLGNTTSMSPGRVS